MVQERNTHLHFFTPFLCPFHLHHLCFLSFSLLFHLHHTAPNFPLGTPPAPRPMHFPMKYLLCIYTLLAGGVSLKLLSAYSFFWNFCMGTIQTHAYPLNLGEPLPWPIGTLTLAGGYRFAWVRVRVALENPRVTHNNHYSLKSLMAWLWLSRMQARPKPPWSCHQGPAWLGSWPQAR